MNRSIRSARERAVIAGAVLLLYLFLAHTGLAAGLLKPRGSQDPAPRIASHAVRVTINNGFARTEVDQRFANDSDRPLEALYTLPLPKRASLGEVSLWVGERELVGEVVERAKAQAVYDEQTQQGKQAALAEKNDFRSFDIAVGNIPAHGEVRVRAVYYQPLEIDLNVGRYVYPLAEGQVDDQRVAFWSVDDAVSGPVRIEIALKSTFPVREVRLPGFEQTAVITAAATPDTATAPAADGAPATTDWQAVIDLPSGGRLDRDVVFYYRLDDRVPARVELVPYRADGSGEGTFMCVITPAADLKPIAEGSDWIFVLDVSGSMQGNKIARLSDGVQQVLGQLRPNDRFRIVTFNDRGRELTSGYVNATPEAVRQWLAKVAVLQAGGGTALFEGLERAYGCLDADRTAGVILVSDGCCNVGPTAHEAFLTLMRKYDVRLFTILVGNGANQPLLERLARDSNGFALNLSESDDIAGRLLQAKAKVLHTCLHDVKVRFEGAPVVDLVPERVGSLYAGEQAVIFGRYRKSGPVEVVMTARISGEQHTWRCRAELPAVDTDNPELERLWALASIDRTMEEIRERGEDSERRGQVVNLGVTYSLVTDYTSMVVVDADVLTAHGIEARNASRVATERVAQAAREQAPARNYNVDNGQTFGGRSSPGIGLGSGPVGPLFVAIAAWLRRRRRAA